MLEMAKQSVWLNTHGMDMHHLCFQWVPNSKVWSCLLFLKSFLSSFLVPSLFLLIYFYSEQEPGSHCPFTDLSWAGSPERAGVRLGPR